MGCATGYRLREAESGIGRCRLEHHPRIDRIGAVGCQGDGQARDIRQGRRAVADIGMQSITFTCNSTIAVATTGTF